MDDGSALAAQPLARFGLCRTLPKRLSAFAEQVQRAEQQRIYALDHEADVKKCDRTRRICSAELGEPSAEVDANSDEPLTVTTFPIPDPNAPATAGDAAATTDTGQ